MRLISNDGEMIGVFTPDKALEEAYERGLDLVEVSPNANPPVTKIMDYGKYKYEQQKKAARAKKKQQTTQVKTVQLSPNIEEHDFQVKLRNAERFIGNNDKVKVTMRFRGREITHSDLGRDVLVRFRNELGDTAVVEQEPKMEGRQMTMMLGPAPDQS